VRRSLLPPVSAPRWPGALLAVSVGLASGGALAQAAPPTVSQLLVDPKDDHHLALRSSFGLLISRDAGVSWDWRCKAGLGYQGSSEPAVAILNGGAVVLGLSTGISTGDAAGCDFKPASGISAHVVDVIAVADTPGAALAVSVAFSDSSSRVWTSLDNARSFQALGAVLPHFTALSLAAPTNAPRRVYMTGLRWGAAVEGAFGVSDDGGKTFTLTPIQDSDSGAQPFIAALNPKRPDTVYLRLTGIPGRLRVSDDAGRSFREALTIPGPLQGLAISAQGDQIFVSSLEAGTYRANTAALKFEQVACGGLPCLAATGSALLGCGDRNRNGFLVGKSLDAGQTFAVLLDAACLTPARCAANTSVGATCAQAWPRVSAELAPPGAACDRTATSKPFSRACFEPNGTSDSRSGTRMATRPALARARAWGCALAPASSTRFNLSLPLTVLLLAAFKRRARRSVVATANLPHAHGAAKAYDVQARMSSARRRPGRP
jgi:hypothetical protein